MRSNKTRAFGFSTKLYLTAYFVLFVISANAMYGFPEGDYPVPECKRWVAPITCEEVYKIQGEVCSAAQNVGTKYYKAIYHSTALAACKEVAKYKNLNGTISATVDGEYGYCTENGSNFSQVNKNVIIPEEVCFYKVSSDYSVFADFPFTTELLDPNSNASQTYYGSEWNTTQRLNIRHKNRQNNNEPIRSQKLFSDITKNRSKFIDKPEWKAIKDYYYPRGEGLTEVKSKPNAGVIHHIIPLIDRKGCRCGTNSYKNAVVISKKLNEEISNDTTNSILQAIIGRYRVF